MFGDIFWFNMSFDYESWIGQAKDRLESLYEQREALNREIDLLERGIQDFLPLTQAAWLGASAGITESVVMVMRQQSHRLFSVPEIRDALVNYGLPMEQKNPLATLHQIIIRLRQKGLIDVTLEAGKNRYRWIGEGGKDYVTEAKAVEAIRHPRKLPSPPPRKSRPFITEAEGKK